MGHGLATALQKTLVLVALGAGAGGGVGLSLAIKDLFDSVPQGQQTKPPEGPKSFIGQFEGWTDTPEGRRYEWLQIRACDDTKCYGRAFVHGRGMVDTEYIILGSTLRGTYTTASKRTGTVEHRLSADGNTFTGYLGTTDTEDGKTFRGDSELKRIFTSSQTEPHAQR